MAFSFRKVPREINRIVDQFDDFTERRFGMSLSRAYLRTFVDRRMRVHDGALAMGPKVAIYLMFPSKGILPSFRIAMRYIASCGYSPVVVSNLPLTGQEVSDLKGIAARIVDRPNKGYDFAGYRDAIRSMGDGIKDLEYLAIFNDSCWFPIDPDHDWLAEAEALSVDFAGSTCHQAIDPEIAPNWSQLEWRYDVTRPEFHYGSYSLLIGERVLRDPGFLEFWLNYRPARLKSRTVRRGETGLTQWIVSNGFSHAATLDTRNLPEILSELTTTRLQRIAWNAISFDRKGMEEAELRAFVFDRADRNALLRLILETVAKTGPAYALQDYDIHDRHGNFLKKSPLKISQLGAEQTMRILDSLTSPNVETFRAEGNDLFRRKFGEPL